MKPTNYAGQNYAGRNSVTNLDTATGIRYGVISQHSVSPDALDDIWRKGKDLAYAGALAEHLLEMRSEFISDPANDLEDFDEDSVTQDFADRYSSDGGLSDILYESDGYKLTGCLSTDLFVLKSPFYTYAQFCSPCVPGAGNLDSFFQSEENQESKDGTEFAAEAEANGFPRVYCLGHDWFESGVAPYGVFSVETGKAVFAAVATAI